MKEILHAFDFWNFNFQVTKLLHCIKLKRQYSIKNVDELKMPYSFNYFQYVSIHLFPLINFIFIHLYSPFYFFLDIYDFVMCFMGWQMNVFRLGYLSLVLNLKYC